jgi:hypothetical protein
MRKVKENFRRVGQVLIAFLAITCFQITVVSAQWHRVKGPDGGTVNALYRTPTGLLAGTSQGLFKSIDDSTWQLVRFRDTTIYHIKSGIGGVWIASNTGIYLSTDSGNTFSIRNSRDTRALTFSGDTVFAAGRGYNAVSFSRNMGISWADFTGSTSNTIIDLEIYKGYLIAALEAGGIYKCPLSGNQLINAGSTGKAFSLKTVNNILIAGTNTGLKVCDSIDFNWNTFPLITDINAIDVSGNIIHAGGTTGLYSSSDQGSTWTKNSILQEQDIKSIRVESNSIFLGFNKEKGISVGTQNASSWRFVNKGLDAHEFRKICATDNFIVCETLQGLFIKIGNADWRLVPEVTATPGILLAKGQDIYKFASTTCQVSNDMGNTWSTVILPKAVNTASLDSLPFLACSGSVYTSLDHGHTWIAYTNGLNNENFTAVYTKGPLVVLGCKSKIYQSFEAGTSWDLEIDLGIYSNTPTAIFKTGNSIIESLGFQGLIRKIDNQSDYNASGIGLKTGLSISKLLNTGNKIFALDQYLGTVDYSVNEGKNWHPLPVTFSLNYPDMAVNAAKIFLAAGTHGLWFHSIDSVPTSFPDENIGCYKMFFEGRNVQGRSIISNSSSYIIGTSGINDFGKSCTGITKVNASTGKMEWNKLYSFNGASTNNASVQFTSDGNYVLAGNEDTSITFRKISPNGDLIFEKKFLFDPTLKHVANTVIETADHGFLIGGSFGPYQGLLIRLNSNGDTLWSKRGYVPLVASLHEYDNGDILVGGFNNLTRLTNNGNTLWTKTLNNVFLNANIKFQKETADELTFSVIDNSFPYESRKVWTVTIDGTGNIIRDDYKIFQKKVQYSEVKRIQTGYLLATSEYDTIGYNSTITRYDSLWNEISVDVLPKPMDLHGFCIDSVGAYTAVGGIAYGWQGFHDFIFKEGCFSFVSVDAPETFAVEKFMIYPNPFNSVFTIAFSEDLTDVDVSVTTTLGQEVYSEKLKSSRNELSIPGLNAGIYLVRLMKGDQLIGIKKVIAQ